MKSLGGLAAAKKLTLSYYVRPDCPESVWGDPVRLRQILVNLVGNAIKFTHEGEIAVHVSRVGAKVRFDVRDTGVGIAPSVRQRIFEPFTQADSSHSRRYGGAGLGLSIVVRLLEAMGGTVEVSSRSGRGQRVLVHDSAAGRCRRHRARASGVGERAGGEVDSDHRAGGDGARHHGRDPARARSLRQRDSRAPRTCRAAASPAPSRPILPSGCSRRS
jgi:anti-sigma regulatory factor (Ser/Thr protein kinase)